MLFSFPTVVQLKVIQQNNAKKEKKMRRGLKVFLVVVLLIVCSESVFAQLNNQMNPEQQQQMMQQTMQSMVIIGSWQIYRDDDRPKGPIPKETMDFWADGRFLISGDHPNKGLYRINGNQLEFLIKKGDRAITAERQFELSAKELKFKNDKIGWVYYKRVSEQPEGEEPDLK